MMSILGPDLDAEIAYRRERLLDTVAPAGSGQRWLSYLGRRTGSVVRRSARRGAARPSTPA